MAARKRPFSFQRPSLALTICALTLLAGCRDDENILSYRKFTAGPAAQVEANFLALSPTEQVAVYVVGISAIGPPIRVLLRFWRRKVIAFCQHWWKN